MFWNKKIILIVLGLALIASVANADFTFGEPVNLGPNVNSSAHDAAPNISSYGLSLYFSSNRPGGYGSWDIWVTTRETADSPWGEPVNLGPNVNTSSAEGTSSISVDGLTLYFSSKRSGGYGKDDLWIVTRDTIDDEWGAAMNLGPTINSSSLDWSPSISADGLELYMHSDRPSSYGGDELWVARRETINDGWGSPENLGPTVNSPSLDATPSVSSDGLLLFFQSNRSGGYGGIVDIWVTTRPTKDADWGTPVNLGPTINTSGFDGNPSISADGSTLYFASTRGGYGGNDLWQVSIDPVVDLNGDGNIDTDDLLIMIENWETDDSTCDIGPMPWGDGVVDIEDLKVFMEYWEQENMPELIEDTE